MAPTGPRDSRRTGRRHQRVEGKTVIPPVLSRSVTPRSKVCPTCSVSFTDEIGRGRARTYCSRACWPQQVTYRGDEPCEIEGCDKPKRSPRAEWCHMHYARWKRHGDPHVVLRDVVHHLECVGCSKET